MVSAQKCSNVENESISEIHLSTTTLTSTRCTVYNPWPAQEKITNILLHKNDPLYDYAVDPIHSIIV